MDEILERVNTAEKHIAVVKNKQAYRDLRQMLANIDRIITEISKEDVECRQRKKQTPRYRELTEQVDAMLNNLEQHITFAALLG